MIQANELRIGNWVNYEQTSHIVTGIKNNVIWSRWKGQENDEDEYLDDFDNYKPIPLSPEILGKCGFVRYNNTWELVSDKNERYGVWCFTIYDYRESGYNYNSAEFPVKLNYLHQLQNLYFALTGEELTVKL